MYWKTKFTVSILILIVSVIESTVFTNTNPVGNESVSVTDLQPFWTNPSDYISPVSFINYSDTSVTSDNLKTTADKTFSSTSQTETFNDSFTESTVVTSTNPVDNKTVSVIDFSSIPTNPSNYMSPVSFVDYSNTFLTSDNLETTADTTFSSKPQTETLTDSFTKDTISTNTIPSERSSSLYTIVPNHFSTTSDWTIISSTSHMILQPMASIALSNPLCDPGYFGENCTELCHNCRMNTCDSLSGACLYGCEDGWQGNDCRQICDTGFYGKHCNSTCDNCIDKLCNHTTGHCDSYCQPGMQGSKCDSVCSRGHFGDNCESFCGYCWNFFCDPVNGSCYFDCKAAPEEDICTNKTTCETGLYGQNCNHTCTQCPGLLCESMTGLCLENCAPISNNLEEICNPVCLYGFYGPNCENICGNCKYNYFCDAVTGKCHDGCKKGWYGELCSEECPHGFHGSNCSETCYTCKNNNCHHETGVCLDGCNPGWQEETCSSACHGHYGENCNETCGHCWENEACDIASGHCMIGCESGWQGALCKTVCDFGTYGLNCDNYCNKSNCNVSVQSCHPVTGKCFNCFTGWTGPNCSECANGFYGLKCNNTCTNCKNNSCNNVTGLCHNGCKPGWKGDMCNNICENGTYGSHCNYSCLGFTHNNCEFQLYPCNHINGDCVQCNPGWNGKICSSECSHGFFGPNCNENCGYCSNNLTCNRFNGTCNSCAKGWINPPFCKTNWKGCNDSEWNSVYDECISVTSQAIQDLVENITTETYETVSESLNNITFHTEELKSTDIDLVMQVIEKLANTSMPSDVAVEATQNIASTISHLMDAKKEVLDTSAQVNNVPNKILMAFDSIIQQLQTNLNTTNSTRIETTNVIAEITTIDKNSPKITLGIATHFNSSSLIPLYNGTTDTVINVDVSIKLPEVILEYVSDQFKDIIPTSFVIIRNDKLFVDPSRNASTPFSIPVISASIGNMSTKIYNLSSPVVLSFLPTMLNLDENFDADKLDFEANCSYWDSYINDNKGGWKFDGCSYNGTENNRSICLCNHLTYFSVLVNMKQSIKQNYVRSLEVISYVGCGLSIGGLIFSLSVSFVIRQFRKTRGSQALMNYQVALLCTLIVFMGGINIKNKNETACRAVAIMLHYFLLASFLWMLVESLLQYLNFVRVIPVTLKKFLWKTIIFAWGVPAVAVASLAGINFEFYKSDIFCWLEMPFLLNGFLIPVGSIMFINLIVFFLIIKSLYFPAIKTKTHKRQKLFFLKLKGIVCSFVLLGLTWIFAIFALLFENIAFQYMFCIFNTLQGFFIALFHYLVIRQKPEWKTSIRRLITIIENNSFVIKKRNFFGNEYSLSDSSLSVPISNASYQYSCKL